MKITICDDCQRDIDVLVSLCKRYGRMRQLEMDITTVTCPLDLDLEETDLLLLDIQMPDISGIEVQRQLQLRTGKPLIIFVTNYHEYIVSSHGINVIGFLEKPVAQDVLFDYLDKGEILLSASKVVTFGKQDCYNTHQIQYIVMESGYSKAVLEDGKKSIGIYKTIKRWLEELQDYGFVRINKSCLVNCEHIKMIKDDKIILNSGDTLRASRRERKAVADGYLTYLQRQARFM